MEVRKSYMSMICYVACIFFEYTYWLLSVFDEYHLSLRVKVSPLIDSFGENTSKESSVSLSLTREKECLS